MDPRTNAVGWRYSPEKDFFSASRGACQRLPNGNTLITLSEGGRVIEVTELLRALILETMSLPREYDAQGRDGNSERDQGNLRRDPRDDLDRKSVV